jgi:hypothetical protein
VEGATLEHDTGSKLEKDIIYLGLLDKACVIELSAFEQSVPPGFKSSQQPKSRNNPANVESGQQRNLPYDGQKNSLTLSNEVYPKSTQQEKGYWLLKMNLNCKSFSNKY